MKHIETSGISKEDRYSDLYIQLMHILGNEQDIIARMATICAAIKEVFDFYWVGFYRIKDNELVVGPYIGTLGCLRIKKGKGVCGYCWEIEKTVIVDDVDTFEGHIACSAASKSEIVVPVFADDKIIAVLDIDSEKKGAFDETDKTYLEKIVSLVDV